MVLSTNAIRTIRTDQVHNVNGARTERGRKHNLDEAAYNHAESESDSDAEEIEAESEEQPKPKRKLGHPRKDPQRRLAKDVAKENTASTQNRSRNRRKDV